MNDRAEGTLPAGSPRPGRWALLGEAVAGWWSAAGEGWNRFWFLPADPATLAVIRILAGALLFYTHLVWTFDLAGFVAPSGRLSVEFGRLHHSSVWAWSYLDILDAPGVLWTVHLLGLVVFLLLTIGLFTRIVAPVAFLVTVAYAHRTAGTQFGLDQINGLLALYLAIGPSGALWSIDAWLADRDAGRTLSVSEQVLANVALRLMQVHMCVIYFFAGAGKLLGDTWWNGEAFWGAIANHEYQTLDVTWLAFHPWAISLATHTIVLWEISYPALVWPRLTRPLVLFLALPLHLGIGLCLGMMEFGLAMLFGNLAFVPPELWRQLLAAPSPDPEPDAASTRSE